MSAERHAMEAALDYSGELEENIKALQQECKEQRMRLDPQPSADRFAHIVGLLQRVQQECKEQRMRNSELRRQLRAVKEAVSDRDMPVGPPGGYSGPNEAMQPMQEAADFKKSSPCCKNCGCPI